MYALLTDQRIPAVETGICDSCYSDDANKLYIREMAGQSDDIDPDSKFHDVSDTHSLLACMICEG